MIKPLFHYTNLWAHCHKSVPGLNPKYSCNGAIPTNILRTSSVTLKLLFVIMDFPAQMLLFQLTLPSSHTQLPAFQKQCLPHLPNFLAHILL